MELRKGMTRFLAGQTEVHHVHIRMEGYLIIDFKWEGNYYRLYWDEVPEEIIPITKYELMEKVNYVFE